MHTAQTCVTLDCHAPDAPTRASHTCHCPPAAVAEPTVAPAPPSAETTAPATEDADLAPGCTCGNCGHGCSRALLRPCCGACMGSGW